jgi:hypothetical protein
VFQTKNQLKIWDRNKYFEYFNTLENCYTKDFNKYGWLLNFINNVKKITSEILDFLSIEKLFNFLNNIFLLKPSHPGSVWILQRLRRNKNSVRECE